MSQKFSRSTIQTRRNFIKLASGGAMANVAFTNRLTINRVMADGPSIPPTGGYKALVCLIFNGGLDSFSVLTPFGTTQSDPRYAEYASTRTELALKRTAAWDGAWTGTDYGYLNPIVDSSAAGGTGRTFGLHPRFTYLKQIYDSGHATFVANCGVLVDPLANNDDYNNAAKIKPVNLYSHADQLRHWQTAKPTLRSQATTGWAGRMIDLFIDPAAGQSNIFSAISVAGQSLLLSGNRTIPYPISSVLNTNPPINGGAVSLVGATSPTTTAYDRIYSKSLNGFANQSYSNVLERTIRNNRADARIAAENFQTAFSNTNSQLPPAPAVQFSTSGIGASLSSVARAISLASDPAAVAPLRQERQIFVVQSTGWDHSASGLSSMNSGIPGIDAGLKAFYDFLVSKSLLDKVTLFSLSEFGRTLVYNGSGSDHAWGGNTIIMGGAINGLPASNRIWGQYPNLAIDTSGTGIDRGSGRLIPQTSSDLYHGELCRWFGVPDSRLAEILPNIGNFPYQGGTRPVGFMNGSG